MNRDKYDMDLLGALRKIAASLDRIEKKLPVTEANLDDISNAYENGYLQGKFEAEEEKKE